MDYLDFQRQFEREMVLCKYAYTTKQNALIFASTQSVFDSLAAFERASRNKKVFVSRDVKKPVNLEQLCANFNNYVLIKQARGYNPQTCLFHDGARLGVYAADSNTLLKYLKYVGENAEMFIGGLAPTLPRVKLTAQLMLNNTKYGEFTFRGNKLGEFADYVERLIDELNLSCN